MARGLNAPARVHFAVLFGLFTVTLAFRCRRHRRRRLPSVSSPRPRSTRSSSRCARRRRRRLRPRADPHCPCRKIRRRQRRSGRGDGSVISAGAKGILVTPNNSTGVLGVVKKARDAGILVIALDTAPTRPMRSTQPSPPIISRRACNRASTPAALGNKTANSPCSTAPRRYGRYVPP